MPIACLPIAVIGCVGCIGYRGYKIGLGLG
jgi:hypothetical protein